MRKIANVFELEGSISLNTGNFEKKVKESMKAAETMSKAFEEAATTTNILENEINSVDTKEFEKNVKDGAKAVEETEKAFEDAGESAKKFTDDLEKTTKESDELGEALKDTQKETEKLGEKTDSTTESEKDADNETERLKEHVKSLGDESSSTGGKIAELGEKIKNGLVTAAKLTTEAIAGATAAITGLTAQAVSEYGNYEQLVGGIETLFGESADKVQQYADEAYKTAGLSANEYMDTVTSFSASLIQSVGRGEQQDLDQLQETLDSEYEYTKQSLSDQYDEQKKYWDSQIKLADSTELKEALRQQKDDELKNLKRSNEEKLKELKSANKERLSEVEKSNNASVTTAESLSQAADLANQAIIDMSD